GGHRDRRAAAEAADLDDAAAGRDRRRALTQPLRLRVGQPAFDVAHAGAGAPDARGAAALRKPSARTAVARTSWMPSRPSAIDVRCAPMAASASGSATEATASAQRKLARSSASRY